MNFKELKRGLTVYILNKETLSFNKGKVVSDATPPRMNTIFGQPMLTDVSIEADNQTKIWSLPADQQIAKQEGTNDTIIATDKTSLVSILKSIKEECDSYIKGIDACKERLQKSESLIAELDVAFKQQQETEERFVRLERSIDGINRQLSSNENTLSQILKAVNGH